MEKVESIIKIIVAIFGILTSYRVVLTVMGLLLPDRKFKKTDKQYNYAVLIAGWNEEKVIAELIDSIKKQDYPQDKITIFVCADRCTDNTAQVARDAGAIVYERINPPQKNRSKGYALDFMLQNIKKDYPEKGIETFDGYFMFDADNLLTSNYVTEMNNAFDNKKFDIFDSYINTKNCGTSFISSYCSIGNAGSNLYNSKPKGWLGLSMYSRGKGVLYRSHLLVRGWRWCGTGIDINASSEFVAKGYRSTYCGTAEVYDEKPIDLKIFLRQRMRWARSRFLAFFRHFFFLIIGIFIPRDWKKNKPESYNKQKFSLLAEVQKRLSCYDGIFRLFPLYILTFIVTILYPLGHIIYSLCTPGTPVGDIIWVIPSYYGLLYLSELATAIVTLVREHKRIRVNPRKLIRHVLFWPFLDILMQYVSMWAVIRNVKWKKIPHVENKTIDTMVSEKTVAEYVYAKDNDKPINKESDNKEQE